MTRISKPTDYTVTADGIGTFTFGRRNNMRDELDVQREYSSILRGVTPTVWFDTLANWFAIFRVMTVHAPDGWDLEAFDPMADDTYAKLQRVYDAMSEKESSFRSDNAAPSQGGGAAPV